MWILPPSNCHCTLRKMVAVLFINYYFAHGELIVLEGSILLLFLFCWKKKSHFCSLWTLLEAEENRLAGHGGLVIGCCTLQKHLVLVSLDQALLRWRESISERDTWGWKHLPHGLMKGFGISQDHKKKLQQDREELLQGSSGFELFL